MPNARLPPWASFGPSVRNGRQCMSPFQSNEAPSMDEAVGEDNWTSIGCIVCHNQHTLELELWNGVERIEVNGTNDLCGASLNPCYGFPGPIKGFGGWAAVSCPLGTLVGFALESWRLSKRPTSSD